MAASELKKTVVRGEQSAEQFYAARRYTARPPRRAAPVLPALPRLHTFNGKQFLEHADGRVTRLSMAEMRAKAKSDYDKMLLAAWEQKGFDNTHVSDVFADAVQERGLPGASAIRESSRQTNRERMNANQFRGAPVEHLDLGQVKAYLYGQRRPTNADDVVNGVLHINHRPVTDYDDNAPMSITVEHRTDAPVGSTYARYGPRSPAPHPIYHHLSVHSVEHLKHVLEDFPSDAREHLVRAARERGLPETRGPAKLARRHGDLQRLAAINVTKPGLKVKPPAPETYPLADAAKPISRPAVRPLAADPFVQRMLNGRVITRRMVDWAHQHAARADVSAFAQKHGYTDPALARKHVAAMFLAAIHEHATNPASANETRLIFRHPSGQNVNIAIRRPVAQPARLARQRLGDTGSALASAGSKNNDARLDVVRQVLAESGLSPATVRAALAHEGKSASASFAAVVTRGAHPDHLRYTAAWLGLLTGQKRLAVVRPDAEGEDFLHVISAPGSPDHMSEALRGAGVERFTTEQTASGGTRAFVLNPLGRYPVERAVQGIPNARHSSARVRVYRIGAGASANADAGDARSAYRSVIDSFESAAGVGKPAANGSAASPA